MTVILMKIIIIIIIIITIIIIIIIITSYSTVLLEKLTGSQLIKKFSAFCGNYGIRRRGFGTDDSCESCKLRLKYDGTRAETKFRLSRETDESI